MKYAYILSPEFHRQLWLNFSPFRLIAAPTVLLLCAVVSSNLDHNMDSRHAEGVELYAMLWLYFFCAIVWGNFEAGTSMHQEMRGNTWDFQRMSSLTPGQLVLGKFFGATSYVWFASAIILAFFAPAYAEHVEKSYSYWGYRGAQEDKNYPIDDTFFVVIGFVLSALVGHAAALLGYFIEMSSVPGRTSRSKLPGGMQSFILGLFVSGILFSMVWNAATHAHYRQGTLFHDTLHWYGTAYSWESSPLSIHAFILLSMLFFLAWFLVGSYRLAREELMYRNLPFAWLAFVASVIFWDSGFFFRACAAHINDDGVRVCRDMDAIGFHWVMFVAFIQVAGVSYAVMLNEASDFRRYARLFFYARRDDLRRMLENTPRWMVTFPLVIPLYFFAVVNAPEVRDHPGLSVHMASFMSALVLLMIRDGLAVHALHFVARGRGSRFMLIFYYVLAYGLLPLAYLTLVQADSGSLWRAIVSLEPDEQVNPAAGLFYPVVMNQPLFTVLPVFLEVLLAGTCLRAILQKSLGRDVIANPKA